MNRHTFGMQPSGNARTVLYSVIAVFAVTGAALLIRTNANPVTPTVEGEFIHSYVDHENHAEGHAYMLKTKDGRYGRLDAGSVGKHAPAGLRTGAKIRIKGKWQGNAIKVDDASQALAVVEDAADGLVQDRPAEQRTYNRAVVLINPKGSATARPVITPTEQRRLLGLPGNPDTFWSAANYGMVKLESTVTPVVDIDVSDMPDCTEAHMYSWADRADKALADLGINMAGFSHRLYVLPITDCGWNGMANIDGPRAWMSFGYAGGRSDNELNGTSAHEFGHNLGLKHAGSLACSESGSRVQISDSCFLNTYGDVFDVMGNSGTPAAMGRLPSAYHRHQLGFLPEPKVQTISAGGSYWLSSINQNPSEAVHPQSLRIARATTGELFDIEYRSASLPYDNFAATDPVVNGITVRLISGSGTAGASSRLLDGTPATGSFQDAPIVGSTVFTDRANGISIRVTARTLTDVQVAVTLDDGGVGQPADPGPQPAPMQSAPGDANRDNRVNALDLSILLNYDGQTYPPADFNKDGAIGAADLAMLLGGWTW